MAIDVIGYATAEYVDSEDLKVKAWAKSTFVNDVKVDGVTVVDGNKVAQISLTDYAKAADLTSEVTRATAREDRISNALSSEGLRAKAAEAALNTKITSEVTRATNAESSLNTSLTNAISAEVTRATNAESALRLLINSEASKVSAEYRKAAAQDIIDAKKQKKLTAGANIVLTSEGVISATIPPTGVMGTLVNGVSVVDSEGIAKIDLTPYATIVMLDSEALRAERVEGLLAAALNSEAMRAQAAELELRNLINSESSRVTAEYRKAADQDLIDATFQKRLIPGENIFIASDGVTIRAEGKVKDVLVNEVSVLLPDGKAKIDLSPYATIVMLDSEAMIARAEEAILRAGLAAEIGRATSEEERIEDKLDAEIVRAIAEDENLFNLITSEGIIRQGADNVLNTLIINETTRATNAETNLGLDIASTNNALAAEVTRATNAETNLHASDVMLKGYVDSENELMRQWVRAIFVYDPINKALNIVTA